MVPMRQPSRADVAAFAAEDAADATEYARNQVNPRWAVVSLSDGRDRDGWPQTDFHRRWWQSHDQDWPEELQDAYIDAFALELTDANFALIELLHESKGREWTSVGVVDLEWWEPEFPFERGKWVRQAYGSTKGWRRKSALRKLRRRRRQR
jgi:hypothetical protein